ncbi:MAG: hypothetical protein AAFU79_25200, partial [Myxococcota bacterium]
MGTIPKETPERAPAVGQPWPLQEEMSRPSEASDAWGELAGHLVGQERQQGLQMLEQCRLERVDSGRRELRMSFEQSLESPALKKTGGRKQGGFLQELPDLARRTVEGPNLPQDILRPASPPRGEG